MAGKELYINPPGRMLVLEEGTYRLKIERINQVLFKLGFERIGETYITALSDLKFENGRHSMDVKVKEGTYFEIISEDGREKFQIVELMAVGEKGHYLGIKKISVAPDGTEVPLISAETRALGGYFYTGVGGPVATFNPALYGEKEIVREVWHLPTYTEMLTLYENGERKKVLLTPWDSHTLAGLEDPRLTTIRVDGRDYVLLTATEYDFNIDHIRTGVYLSPDFKKWERIGAIRFLHFWKENHVLNKSVHLASVYREGIPYAYKVNGQYVGMMGEGKLLAVITSKDLKHWSHRGFVIEKGLTWWSETLVEVGTLIRTKDGYVLLMDGRDRRRRYAMGWVILDENFQVVDVSENPVIAPTESWERAGIAANVTFFPNGITTRAGHTKFIYGAADQRVGKIEINNGIKNTLEVTSRELVDRILEPIAEYSKEFRD